MLLPEEKQYTIDYIYSLQEGERAELIDGHIYNMTLPARQHQDIAPFAVFLNADNRNYVEPDISVICDPNKLTDKGCNGAPDWIVDAYKNRIMVYDLAAGGMEDYTFSDSVKAGIFPDLLIDFAQLDI